MTEHVFSRLRRFTWMPVLAVASVTAAAELMHAAAGLVPWIALGVLVGDAVAFGVLTVGLRGRRSSTALAATPNGHERHLELAAARHLVERYGEDSISPFIIRPDKSYEFAAGGVLAYRVFGRTAIVSGDPIGPAGAAPAVLDSFLETARVRGWEVVVYGASPDQLESYHRLGLRSICVGEEAVVRPERFTLDGRQMRKLRQSVHRMQRRGWRISACDGVDIDAGTEAEIDALEARWRAQQPRMLGFAMSMGPFEGGVVPADLYVLARSPEGTLAAAMRFIVHRGKLSLDTMRRVGETPNGLNEALVCHALEVARERGICEVSLNYAGLAHLVRRPSSGGWARQKAVGLVLTRLGCHFQMERLVRFNEKFAPDWRPRYLIYPSRRALPRAVYRVLEAEGYVARRRSTGQSPASLPAPRARRALLPVDSSGP